MSINDNPIFEDFTALKLLLRMVIKNRRPPGAVVIWPPGLGKTYTVRELYREYYGHSIPEFSQGTGRALIDFVSNHRSEIILLDDCDQCFYDPKMLTLFKKMLDSNEPRHISYYAKGSTVEPFRFTGAVIICTNFDLDQPSNWSQGFYRGYIEPFKSRCSASITRFTFTEIDLVSYALHIAPDILRKIPAINGKRLTDAEIHYLTELFRMNWRQFPEKSPRMIHNLGEARLSCLDVGDEDDWQLWLRRKVKEWTEEKRKEEAERIRKLEQWKREAEQAERETTRALWGEQTDKVTGKGSIH